MRDVAQRAALLTASARCATLAAALVLGCLLGERPAQAARPNAQAAAEFLAGEHGGQEADFVVVYQRPARSSGETVWAAKLVDRRTGAVSLVYRDAAGVVGGPGLLRGRERAVAVRQTAMERKATPSLQHAVQGRLSRLTISGRTGASLPVAVWLSADVADAELGLMAGVLMSPRVADRPVVNDLAAVRSLRGRVLERRRRYLRRCGPALRDQVRRLNGHVAYASASAPLVFLDLPATAVASVGPAGRRGEPGPRGRVEARRWRPPAGPWTRTGPWGAAMAATGCAWRWSNITTCGAAATSTGKVVRSHSTTGRAFTGGGQFDHPTWSPAPLPARTAPGRVWHRARASGVVRHGWLQRFPRLRPTHHRRRRLVHRAGGDNTDIVNTSLVQDTATGAEEGRRYFDSLVDQDGRLAISAAGNYVNFGGWQIGSPGTGYNVSPSAA